MGRAFLYIVLILVINLSYGQVDNHATIEPSLGVSFRSASFLFFNYNYVERVNLQFKDYRFESNFQGFSLEPRLKLVFNDPKLSLSFVPLLRYDDLYTRVNQTDSSFSTTAIKEFIIDPHFALGYRLSANLEIGLGYTIVNAGKNYVNHDVIKNKVQFNTWNLILEGLLNRYSYFLRVHYIPKGEVPGNPKDDYLSISVGVAFCFSKRNTKN